MTKAQIIDLQTQIGTTPDGFWGPKSIAACKRHLKGLMPSEHPWPTTSEAELRKFYGPSCDEDALVNLIAPVPMYFDGKKIKTLRCHELVAESLSRVLSALGDVAPKIVRVYDGCYNCRNMRGSSVISTHARGIAIDLDAEHNGNHVHWPLSATMPLVVMEAFAREGWLSAGAFWSRDAMHFQATR